MQIGHDSNSHYISTTGSNRTLNISASGTLDWYDLQLSSDGHLSINSTDAAAQLTITPSGTNANARINIIPPGTGRAIFQYGGTERISYNATGVGIFGITPDSKFQIANANSSSYRFGYGGTSDIYFDTDTLYCRSANGGVNTMTLRSGNLIVGSSTVPDAKLEVYVTSGGQQNHLRLKNNFSGGNTVDLNPYIAGVSNAGFSLKVGSLTPLMIDSGGNLILQKKWWCLRSV